MKMIKKLQTEDLNMGSLGKLKTVQMLKDPESDEKVEDKNRQGNIRTVKGAHLIYKRENGTDRYDELWVYQTNQFGMYQDLDIKNSILSGTDIPINKSSSDNGEQYFDISHYGDTVFLKITNLSN